MNFFLFSLERVWSEDVKNKYWLENRADRRIKGKRRADIPPFLPPCEASFGESSLDCKKQNGYSRLSRFVEARWNWIAQATACFCGSVQWSSHWVKLVSSSFMSKLFYALQKMLAIRGFEGRFNWLDCCFSQGWMRKMSWSTVVPLGLLLVQNLKGYSQSNLQRRIGRQTVPTVALRSHTMSSFDPALAARSGASFWTRFSASQNCMKTSFSARSIFRRLAVCFSYQFF